MNLTIAQARKKLKDFAVNTRNIKLTKHAKERMADREISLQQIVSCFKHGEIIEGPYLNTKGHMQLNVSARTAGEYLTVVAVFKENENGEIAIIVTAFKE